MGPNDEALIRFPTPSPLPVPHTCLDQCLEQLPAAHRELLRVAYIPGMKINDIAIETGRSAQALYKTIQRLRAALLLCVERRIREVTP